MIAAIKLVVTFKCFGIPTKPGETNQTMIKHKIFEAMKDDLNDPDGVNNYVNTVTTFILHEGTTYTEATKRMAELTEEIIQLSRVAWEYEPSVELLTQQIRTLLNAIDSK